jgi:hypothetical protein
MAWPAQLRTKLLEPMTSPSPEQGPMSALKVVLIVITLPHDPAVAANVVLDVEVVQEENVLLFVVVDELEDELLVVVVEVAQEEDVLLFVVVDELEDELLAVVLCEDEVVVFGVPELVEDLPPPPMNTAAPKAAAVRMTTTITTIATCPIPALPFL